MDEEILNPFHSNYLGERTGARPIVRLTGVRRVGGQVSGQHHVTLFDYEADELAREIGTGF